MFINSLSGNYFSSPRFGHIIGAVVVKGNMKKAKIDSNPHLQSLLQFPIPAAARSRYSVTINGKTITLFSEYERGKEEEFKKLDLLEHGKSLDISADNHFEVSIPKNPSEFSKKIEELVKSVKKDEGIYFKEIDLNLAKPYIARLGSKLEPKLQTNDASVYGAITIPKRQRPVLMSVLESIKSLGDRLKCENRI